MEKAGISKFVDPEEMKSSAWSRRRVRNAKQVSVIVIERLC